jgi:hypothetical protein
MRMFIVACFCRWHCCRGNGCCSLQYLCRNLPLQRLRNPARDFSAAGLRHNDHWDDLWDG